MDLIKLGQKVMDRWYPSWGIGKVVKESPKVVNVMFPVGKRTYTQTEFKYLAPVMPPEAVSWKS